MGFWKGFALGIMSGGVLGVIVTAVMVAFRDDDDECADCQAEIIRSLQGKIKGA